MPLINCKVCSKEISKTAQICPHCGEKNIIPTASRKPLVYLLYAIIFMLSIFGILMIGNGLTTAIKGGTEIYTIPPLCTSEDGIQKVKQAFAQSPAAKTFNLQIITIENSSQYKYELENKLRYCMATALFNSGQSTSIGYQFQVTSEGALLVTTSVSTN